MSRTRAFWPLFFSTVLAVVLLAHPPGALARPNPTVAPPSTPATPSSGFDSLNNGSLNPACSGATGQAAANCAISNSPASAFPTDSYGLDQNIDTGLTGSSGWLPSAIDDIIGWFFGTLGTLLSFLFMLLGLVFNFDLFTTGLSRISSSLGSAYTAFTLPLLGVAFAVMGVVALMHMAKGAHGRAWGHMFATFALMLVGAAIILQPGATLGPLDQAGNKLASAGIGVFSGQGVSSNSYASTTAPLWKTTIEEPWCALEFHDVTQFCMAPIIPQMAQQRDSVIQNIDKAAGDQADAAYAKAHAPQEVRLLRTAKTNGQLFLAFPANWDARNGKADSWTLAQPLVQDSIPGGAELWYARTSGGVGERIGTLVLIAIGIFFLLLLLAYVCMYLFAAAIMFVVLLMFAPFMILTPAFGDSGRVAFVNWLKKTLFMLLAKVIYAIFLGVVIGISLLLPAITAPFGWWVQWGVWAIFWFLAWKHRGLLPDMMTSGQHSEHSEHHDHSTAALAGGYAVGHAIGSRAKPLGAGRAYYKGRDAWRRGRDAWAGRGGNDGEDGADGANGAGDTGPYGPGGGGPSNVTPRFGQTILPSWSHDEMASKRGLPEPNYIDGHAADIDEQAGLPVEASSNGHGSFDGVAFIKNPNLAQNHGDQLRDADGNTANGRADEIRPVIVPATSNGHSSNGKTNGKRPAPPPADDVTEERVEPKPRLSNGHGWIDISNEERQALVNEVRRRNGRDPRPPDTDEHYGREIAPPE